MNATVIRNQKKELKREYEERKRQIQKSDQYFKELLRESWKPEQYKYELELTIQDLKRQRQQGLIIATDKEYKEAVKKAKREYKKKKREFATGKGKIEAIKEKYTNADAILTATEKISIYNYVLNNNVLIFGGSGCGKTRNYLVPNVLQAHSSYVITDPKGEILAKTGYFLEKMKGYNIRVLNLDEPSHSDGYNPFAYIHPEREGYEERVLTLIETIIMNTDGGEAKSGSDPFWDKAERCFLQALFFFTCVAFPKEEQNINTFLKLMSWLKLEEENDQKDSPLDCFVNNQFAPKYGEDHIGVQQYREFRDKASGKTAKSIVMSAVARFAPFRTKEISRILSADSMNLEVLGEQKTAIFVVVPPTNTTFNFMAGMLFTQMFQELQYCATQVHKAEGQRLPVPVRFLLDEFANTCKIPQFEQIIAYARSLGIGICPILQSLEQLKKMFKESWGVIIDNCNCMLYLGNVTHPETLEYLVKLVGKGTFDKKSTSRTRGRSGSSSTSYDKIGRELLDMSEIRKLPKSDCLLIVGGRPPFWSKKFDYPSHPNYKYTSDANDRFFYDYTPIEIKEKKRKVSLEKDRAKIEVAQKEREQRISAGVKQRKATILAGIDQSLTKIEISRNTNEVLNGFANSKGRLAVVKNEDFGDGSYKDEDFFEDNREIALAFLNAEDSFNARLTETLGGIEENHIELVTDSDKLIASFADEASKGELLPMSDDLMNDGSYADSDFVYEEEKQDIVQDEVEVSHGDTVEQTGQEESSDVTSQSDEKKLVENSENIVDSIRESQEDDSIKLKSALSVGKQFIDEMKENKLSPITDDDLSDGSYTDSEITEVSHGDTEYEIINSEEESSVIDWMETFENLFDDVNEINNLNLS